MENDKIEIEDRVIAGAHNIVDLAKLLYDFDTGSKAIMYAAAAIIKAGHMFCEKHTEEKLMAFFQAALEDNEKKIKESIDKQEELQKESAVNITKMLLGIRE